MKEIFTSPTQDSRTEKDNPRQLGCLVHGTKLQRIATLQSRVWHFACIGEALVCILLLFIILYYDASNPSVLLLHSVSEGIHVLKDNTLFIILLKIEFVKHPAARPNLKIFAPIFNSQCNLLHCLLATSVPARRVRPSNLRHFGLYAQPAWLRREPSA